MRKRRTLMAFAALATLAASLTAVAPALAAKPPAVTATRSTGVDIEDVTIPVPGQGAPVHAWLVRPEGPAAAHSRAGILFLHWLGDLNSDRDEYLAEATSLAKQGAVSILPDGVFPYTGAGPVGTAADVASVGNQEAAFRAALNALFHRNDVDPSRIAVVGHDYGAMYGSLIADADPRIKTAVLGTPDATWGDWFLNFFGLTLTGQQAADYAAGFARLDPQNHLKRLGSGLMLQFASDDPFITADTRATMAANAPKANVKLYTAQHQLNDQARADRDAFLAARLHLAPAS